MSDDFFGDDDEECYSVLKLCNMFETLEDDKEKIEDKVRISLRLTQESTQKTIERSILSNKNRMQGGRTPTRSTRSRYIVTCFDRCAQNAKSIRRR